MRVGCSTRSSCGRASASSACAPSPRCRAEPPCARSSPGRRHEARRVGLGEGGCAVGSLCLGAAAEVFDGPHLHRISAAQASTGDDATSHRSDMLAPTKCVKLRIARRCSRGWPIRRLRPHLPAESRSSLGSTTSPRWNSADALAMRPSLFAAHEILGFQAESPDIGRTRARY